MDKKSFYQWDLDRRLELPGVAVGTEIHFCNPQSKETECLTVFAKEENGVVYAEVPNVILQIAGSFKVYVWPFHTTQYQQITVIARPKPTDYIYEEIEIYTIEQVVNNGLKKAKESGEFDGKDGKDGVDGKDGHTPEKGVDYYTEADKAKLVLEVSKTVTVGGANVWRCTVANSNHDDGNPWCSFDDIADFDENKAKVGDIIIDAEGTVLEIVTIGEYGQRNCYCKKIGCGYAEINVPFTYWEGYVGKNFDEGNITLSILTSQVTNDESRLPREGELLIDTWGNWFFICSVDVDNNTAFVKKLVPTEKISDLEVSVGDIETALDRIIEIQNSLIGGETV